MKLGKWLSNVQKVLKDEREIEWRRLHLTGPPKATEYYTVQELEAEGYIGIYAHADKRSRDD